MFFRKLLSLALLGAVLTTPGNAQWNSGIISAAPGFVSSILNVKGQGATGDFQTFEDAVMTAGSPTLTKNNGAIFTPASVGKTIIVTGALGVASAPLVSTILTYTSSTQVTLADNATHDTANSFLTAASFPDNTAITGNYAPGDNLACTAGTTVGGANCVARVYTTQIEAISNTIVNAGTGATGSFCYLSTTTGTGSPVIVRYPVSAGSIVNPPSFIARGTYFTNPTTPANAVMTDARANVNGGCGITGVILNITSIGINNLTVDTVGEYSATVTTMTTGAGSISGATGATFTPSWTDTGQGGWGTDDTINVKKAIDLAITNFGLGQRSVLYFPAGNYLINGGPGGATTLPICNWPCGYKGDAVSASSITVGPSYTASGLLTWHNTWIGNDAPASGGSLNFNASLVGANVQDLQFTGFTTSTPEVTAMLMQGRTSGARVRNVSCSYIASCLRAGILNGTSDLVANVQESEFADVRTRLAGSSTLPAVHLTATTTSGLNKVACPNNLNIIDLNIFASAKDGLVLDCTGLGTSQGGNNKGINLRVEGVARRGIVGAGDLFRIGSSTATSNSAMSGFTATNLNLIGPVADTAAPVYYCGLRVASAYVTNVVLTSLRSNAASGGSNGVCIDGGSNVQIDFARITSALYDVSVASSTTVGTGLVFNLLDDPAINSPYRWNVDATSLASINSNIYIKNNAIYSSGLPTGNFNFNGRITANTDGAFATTGLFGSYQGSFTATTVVTWPTDVRYIRIRAASQGGCGGGGSMATLGSVASGGGGGGGGRIVDRFFARAELGNSTTFTIGTPCVGGRGATVNGPGTAGGSGGTAGAGSSVSWTLANGNTITIYGGGYGSGGGIGAGTSSGGGGAGVGGAGNANVAGAGATATNLMSGTTGGAGAAGTSVTANTVAQDIGVAGGGASVTTGNKGGDTLSCPGGGSGGTLLAASASVGGAGGGAAMTGTAAGPSGGASGGGAGNPAQGYGLQLGGNAPSGGGGNTAGAGGNGGGAALVPCVGGGGGGSGTTRGGDGTAGGPATVYYTAW